MEVFWPKLTGRARAAAALSGGTLEERGLCVSRSADMLVPLVTMRP